MKPIEEALASTGFRRVILPGIVLTIGIHPILSRWIPVIADVYGVLPTVFLITEVIFLGLVVSSGIQWIYYLYEGFRIPQVTLLAKWTNQKKLVRLQEEYRQIQGERNYDDLTDEQKNRIIRLYEYLCDFPIRDGPDGITERYVERPTRLGNVIATYELYPSTRYGIDGVYYWHHILNLAPDTARKHFEEQYAFAESLLLTSFAGAIVTAIHGLLMLGFWLGSLGFVVVSLYVGPILSALLAAFGLSSWLLFYYAALPAHRSAGIAFRAIVDAVISKFADWAESTHAPLKPDLREKAKAFADYDGMCVDSLAKRM